MTNHHHDEEHTSLTAAVAALGDDAGRQPSVEEIAVQRRAEVRERVIAVIQDGEGDSARRIAEEILFEIERAGFQVVQRRPE